MLEAFITPSLFDSFDCSSCLDEWHIGKDVSKSKATKILTNHFNSFITEADFAKIASLGLNHIRIPVGFWAMGKLVGSEPYLVLNQYDKLKEAVSWALKYDLKVLLDLHGAPGSQNGRVLCLSRPILGKRSHQCLFSLSAVSITLDTLVPPTGRRNRVESIGQSTTSRC